MANWEYKRIDLDQELTEHDLNNYGQEGWELVHHQSFFRRPFDRNKFDTGGRLGFKYHFKRPAKRNKRSK